MPGPDPYEHFNAVWLLSAAFFYTKVITYSFSDYVDYDERPHLPSRRLSHLYGTSGLSTAFRSPIPRQSRY